MNALADAYLETLAPGTRRTARSDLRAAAEAAWPGEDPPPWSTLDPAACARLRGSLAARYTPASANRALSAVRGVVRAGWRLGELSFDAHVRLLASLPRLRGGRVDRGRALTWPEVGRLLAAAPDAERRALLAVAAGAGLRRAELCALTWERVSGGWQLGEPDWRIRVLGKGNRERNLRLPRWAAEALHAWKREARRAGPLDTFVFRWRDGRSVWTVVDSAAARAGLGLVAPHDLRRTFASLALSTGIGVADLRRMMGHSSIKTTIGYDKRPEAAIMVAAARLDNPGALDTPAPGRYPGGVPDGSTPDR